MHVSSRGPRRLPRVASNTQSKSGSNAGRSTISLLNAIVPASEEEEVGGRQAAAQEAAMVAAEAAAHSARNFAADPQAAISSIFEKAPTESVDDDVSQASEDQYQEDNALLSLNAPFFPETGAAEVKGASGLSSSSAIQSTSMTSRRKSRVAGLGSRKR